MYAEHLSVAVPVAISGLRHLPFTNALTCSHRIHWPYTLLFVCISRRRMHSRGTALLILNTIVTVVVWCAVHFRSNASTRSKSSARLLTSLWLTHNLLRLLLWSAGLPWHKRRTRRRVERVFALARRHLLLLWLSSLWGFGRALRLKRRWALLLRLRWLLSLLLTLLLRRSTRNNDHWLTRARKHIQVRRVELVNDVRLRRQQHLLLQALTPIRLVRLVAALALRLPL